MSVVSQYRVHDLHEGCVLATIAHAVASLSYPELAAEQSWTGPSYNVQDSAGTLGTITFHAAGIFGAFFDVRSSRAARANEVTAHLDDTPEPLLVARDETLQFLLQDVDGRVQPVITSAFWSEADLLASWEPWASVRAHGAHLIDRQLAGGDAPPESWQLAQSLTDAQLELVRRIHQHRRLNDEDHAAIARYTRAARDACIEVLAQIGIALSSTGGEAPL
jgi:hypothetical protein